MTNWFDMESHPSDSLIHWQDREPRGRRWVSPVTGEFKTFEEYVKALRAAYDLVHSDPQIAAAYKLLMDARSNVASAEQGEQEAGIDI